MQRAPQHLGEGLDVPSAGHIRDCLTRFGEPRSQPNGVPSAPNRNRVARVNIASYSTGLWVPKLTDLSATTEDVVISGDRVVAASGTAGPTPPSRVRH